MASTTSSSSNVKPRCRRSSSPQGLAGRGRSRMLSEWRTSNASIIAWLPRPSARFGHIHDAVPLWKDPPAEQPDLLGFEPDKAAGVGPRFEGAEIFGGFADPDCVDWNAV